MFQFPRLATAGYEFTVGWQGYALRGLSHSEISGSSLASSSPKLFAAVHVLRRLSSPRYPPCALCSLTISLRHASSWCPESERRVRYLSTSNHWNDRIASTTQSGRRGSRELLTPAHTLVEIAL